MNRDDGHPPLARRPFLSQLGAGAATFGSVFGAGTTSAQAQQGDDRRWRPRRHAQDDWLDELPGDHRLVFDTTTAEGFEKAARYAHNYLLGSDNAYALKSGDLAIVVIVRHLATVFAYNDAMWAKYGTPLSQMINFSDRRTKQPPDKNVYKSGRIDSLDSLTARGVRFAVCEMATREFAGLLAQRTSGDADAIHKELMSNLIAGSHAVPAGIITVNRAQERGYTLAHGG